MKEEIKNALRDIEKAFIIYYGEDNLENKEKITRVFSKLRIVGFSNNSNIDADNNKDELKVDFIVANDGTTEFSEKYLKKLHEILNSYNTYNTDFAYPYMTVPTIFIKNNANKFSFSNVIHEISHVLMIELLGKVYNNKNNYLGMCILASTAPEGLKNNFTNEIINERIATDVFIIFENLRCNNSKFRFSDYIYVDEVLNFAGMTIYNMLKPYLKSHILYNANIIGKIMGEDNYMRYHNLFRKVYKNMMSSSHKTKNDYQDYLESHVLEIYQWQLEAEKIVEDVKANIKEYSQYEENIRIMIDEAARKGLVRKL